PSVREIDAIRQAVGSRHPERREDGGLANRRPKTGEQFRASGAEIEDRHRVGAAETVRRHGPSLLWCAAVQGRRLVLQGRVHSDSSEEPIMERRILGKTGVEVAVLGFGCGAVGGLMVRGTAADQERAVARALGLGINYFDTAPVYGNGESEKNLGRVLKTLRPSVVV